MYVGGFVRVLVTKVCMCVCGGDKGGAEEEGRVPHTDDRRWGGISSSTQPTSGLSTLQQLLYEAGGVVRLAWTHVRDEIMQNLPGEERRQQLRRCPHKSGPAENTTSTHPQVRSFIRPKIMYTKHRDNQTDRQTDRRCPLTRWPSFGDTHVLHENHRATPVPVGVAERKPRVVSRRQERRPSVYEPRHHLRSP